MKSRIGASVAVLLVLCVACRPQTQVGSPITTGRATVRNAAGATLGVLLFEPTSAGVHITGTLTSLPAGEHGIHLHRVGKCEASDFSTAASHSNPGAAPRKSMRAAPNESTMRRSRGLPSGALRLTKAAFD